MLRTLSLLAPLSLVFLTGAFALPPEDISQFPLFTSGKENYHTFRIPSLLVTPKGNLLAICEGRKNNSADHGDIDLVMKRSTDGGLTWSKLSVLIAGGGKTMGNPCPVADKKTGAILLPFCLDNKIVFVMKSSDDGLTWSKPADITRQVMKAGWSWYATGPGVGIQTRSGRLVIPCDSKSGGGKVRESHLIYSDNGGESWQIGGLAAPLCNECQVAELSNGYLHLNIRSYRGNNRRLVAISKDTGETFADPVEDSSLIEPVCQASLIHHEGIKGGLLFANPASLKREKMTVRRSRDDGKTWTGALVLYPGPSAYSSLAALPNGTIYCLYEQGLKGAYETLTLARFHTRLLTQE